MDKTRTAKKTATVYVQLNGNAVSLHNIRKLAQLNLIFCNTQESDMAIQQCIQGVSKKTQPRNFPRNRHCFKDKRF